MIRAKITKLINAELEGNPYFKDNDFQIVVGDAYSTKKLTIIYEYDPQYLVEMDIPTEKDVFFKERSNYLGTVSKEEYYDYKISGSMVPGQIALKESFSYQGASGINKAISAWLNNLWEEITITPENRLFKAQKEEIEKIKSKITGIPDEYFTVEEGNVLKERLEKIESQLTEKLLAEQPNKEEAEKQIEKLHKEIETLNRTVYSLKKEGWFKSFITKTMTWLANPNNQKLLSAGKDIVANMLPEGKHMP